MLCHPLFTCISDSPVAKVSDSKLNDPSLNQVKSASPEMFPVLCMIAKTCTEDCIKICNAICRNSNDLKS